TEGNRVAIETTFFPLFDSAGKVVHIAVVFKDVTEVVRAREQVEAERARLLAILEEMPEAILITSAAGEITFANGEAERLLGFADLRGPWEVVARTLRMSRTDGTPLRLEEFPTCRVLQGEASVLGEEQLLDGPDGARSLLVNAVPRRDRDG